ncbi:MULTISPECIES: hypothetical protein [unclassified Exiguobacterium]|uniref:hypothetical protein n=1 Tax=unclassified Exiguobacterium TaxID=2644629 RepID=UPI001BEB17FA|nr:MULTISPECIES: hypothetical protein [unclassified Exiguobacterium]
MNEGITLNEDITLNEIEIKRRDFERANNRLKEFSEKTEAKIKIDDVRTDGRFFGLGDYKVTGSELNKRLEAIQENFKTVNKINSKTVQEFREVYNVFDKLDKGYITSIVSNVKAIEKTSNDVREQQGILKRHNDKLANQQNKLDAHQSEIEKNVANISKIVSALKVFKEKLEGYKHLTDIDKIWNDCRTIQNEIRVVSDSITEFSKKTTEDIASANHQNKALSDQVNRDILTLRNEAKSFKEFFSDLTKKIDHTANILDHQIPVIQETATFAEQLKDMAHLDDVDFMWNDLHDAKESFKDIEESLQKINEKILVIETRTNDLDSYITVLKSYTHLHDIDEIWTDLSAAKSEIKKIITEINDVSIKTEEHTLRINKLEQTDKVHAGTLEKLAQVDDRILQRIDSYDGEIDDLNKFKEELEGISHLKDVDRLWELVEEQASQLIESKEDLTTSIQKNKDEVDEKITDVVKSSDAAVETLVKKIKYAYWIAGGSAGLAILEMILLLMKVI